MTALALVAAVLLQAPQDPPAHVRASLSAERIAVGETTTLRIEVESRGVSSPDIGRPVLPAGLDLVGTSDFSQLRIARPGQNIRSTRRELMLAAMAPGVYEIPPIQVAIGSQRMYTDRLILTVTGGAAGLRGPGLGRMEDAALLPTTTLRLSLAPDTVYVGQQVILTAEATFAEESRFRQTRPASFEPPATTGFWVQDLPDPVTVTLRVRDGRSVETQTFRRAYFPLSAGTLSVPPAYLHYELRRGFLQNPETRRVASDSSRLVVRSLPAAGRPPAFAGAVGRYELNASLSPRRVAVGEAAVLTVELRGTGNVRALPEPVLPALDDVELFPPTQDATVHVEHDVVGGSARFRWMMVPERARTWVIPPVEYAYFDPELRTYVTLRSDSLLLEALPVAAGQPADTALRPLRRRPGEAPAGWALTTWFAAIQAVPLLLFGLAGAVRRRRERPPGPAQHARRIHIALAALRSRAGEPAVLAEIERLLTEAVRCVAGVVTGDPAAGLRALGRPGAAGDYEDLVADLRRARYAPDAAVEPGALLERAGRFVDSLAGTRRPGAAFGLIALIALIAVAAAAGAGQARADGREDVLFARAVASYEAGDVVAAANAFHDYARLRPHDPDGWYNLGLAAWRAGDPGRAGWAWLRAARLAPRDADTRHNLAFAASPEAVAAVLPADRLAAGERAAAAAVAWWLLVFGLAGGLLRRPRLRWLIPPAALALIVFATAAGARAAIRPVVVPLGQGTTAFAGPSIHDDVVAALHPGTALRLVERRDPWLLVRLADGSLAWVERARVAAP